MLKKDYTDQNGLNEHRKKLKIIGFRFPIRKKANEKKMTAINDIQRDKTKIAWIRNRKKQQKLFAIITNLFFSCRSNCDWNINLFNFNLRSLNYCVNSSNTRFSTKTLNSWCVKYDDFVLLQCYTCLCILISIREHEIRDELTKRN